MVAEKDQAGCSYNEDSHAPRASVRSERAHASTTTRGACINGTSATYLALCVVPSSRASSRTARSCIAPSRARLAPLRPEQERRAACTVSPVKLYLFQSAGVPAYYPNKPPAPRKDSARLGSRTPASPLGRCAPSGAWGSGILGLPPGPPGGSSKSRLPTPSRGTAKRRGRGRIWYLSPLAAQAP